MLVALVCRSCVAASSRSRSRDVLALRILSAPVRADTGALNGGGGTGLDGGLPGAGKLVDAGGAV